jgi:hypothetical protein
VVDPELQRLARRRQNRRLALVLPIVLVPWVVVLGWTVWQAHAYADGSSWALGKTPRLLIFAAILLVFFGLELAVFLWLRRRGVRWLQPSPSLGLDRRERRRLLRAIRQGEPLSGHDGELARDLAQRLVQQRWLVGVILVALVLEVAVVLLRGLDAFGVLLLIVAVLAAVAIPLSVRDVRRARTYLELDLAANPRHQP